jgi:hypothetical protein
MTTMHQSISMLLTLQLKMTNGAPSPFDFVWLLDGIISYIWIRGYIFLDNGYKIWLHLSEDRVRPIITKLQTSLKCSAKAKKHTR